MPTFEVVPIPAEVADEVRRTRRSPRYGHPAVDEMAAGYGPCRVCLCRFRVGDDRRLLFTYDPFAGLAEVPLPGPIFIHADACQPHEPRAGMPPELRELPLVLEAYGAGRWLLTHERARPDRLDEAIERLLALPAAEYVHIRNAEAGCYIARAQLPR